MVTTMQQTIQKEHSLCLLLTLLNTTFPNITLTAEYSKSAVLINTQRINASGSGSVVQIGLETTVNGKEIAIQQLNVQSLVGRMI